MYYIGVDLGGTTIKVGLVDENYNIIQNAVAPTLADREASEILKDMAMLCQQVMDQQDITAKDVHSIGVGSPGVAAPKDGIIVYSNNVNFKNVNVKEEIQKYIDLNVYVDNDANVAALGEALAGAAKGKKDVMMITLGTGVGGGIILDGKIYSGAFFGGGEIGHATIQVEGGLQCTCGRTGCLEQYASATALIRQAKEAVKEHPGSKVVELAEDQNIENINAKVVFDAAQLGDEVAQNVLDQYFKYIATGAANMIHILQPETIVLGGGMSAQKENLTDPVKVYTEEQLYPGLRGKTEIKAATLGNGAGIIGAAFIGKAYQ